MISTCYPYRPFHKCAFLCRPVLARGERLRAVAGLIGEAGRRGVEVRLETRVARVTGGPGMWVLTCSGLEPVKVQHLIVCIGRVARDELLSGLIVGGFEPGVEQKSLPGLFLSGDLIRGRDRYVATAMGDGQRAAVAAAAYLHPTGAAPLKR